MRVQVRLEGRIDTIGRFFVGSPFFNGNIWGA